MPPLHPLPSLSSAALSNADQATIFIPRPSSLCRLSFHALRNPHPRPGWDAGHTVGRSGRSIAGRARQAQSQHPLSDDADGPARSCDPRLRASKSYSPCCLQSWLALTSLLLFAHDRLRSISTSTSSSRCETSSLLWAEELSWKLQGTSSSEP